jgi:hypothetical protein
VPWHPLHLQRGRGRGQCQEVFARDVAGVSHLGAADGVEAV